MSLSILTGELEDYETDLKRASYRRGTAYPHKQEIYSKAHVLIFWYRKGILYLHLHHTVKVIMLLEYNNGTL